jgi:hypothetical protein
MSGTTTGNPQIALGTLNRVRGQVQVTNFPALNVSASFMGEAGFTITRASPGTTMINTMTGRVVSPEPYMAITAEIHLVKSQNLAQLWENQLVNLSAIGPMLFYGDASTLGTFSFVNCAIETIGPIQNNGKSAEYVITVMGTYIINNGLFALTV